MAWAGHCALRRHDRARHQRRRRVRPAQPDASRRRCTARARTSTLETHRGDSRSAIAAVLVAGRYGLVAACPISAPMDIYDVRDCAHPKLLTTFTLPREHPQPDDLARRQPRVRHAAAAGRSTSTIPRTRRSSATSRTTSRSRPSAAGRLQVPRARGRDEPRRQHALPRRADAAVRLVHDRRHHRLAGSARRRCSARSRAAATRSAWRRSTGRTYVLHSEESIVGPTAKGCVPSDAQPVRRRGRSRG